jgi:hypothetical protein
MPPPHRARHRSPAGAPSGPDDATVNAALGHEGDLDTYLAALVGDGGVDGDRATEQTGRFGTAQVVQLRLPALRLEQLRRIAQERGVSPAALAVDWIVERLDREDPTTGPLPLAFDERFRRGPRG